MQIYCLWAHYQLFPLLGSMKETQVQGFLGTGSMLTIWSEIPKVIFIWMTKVKNVHYSDRCELTIPWRDSERPGCRSPLASPGWWSSPDMYCLWDHRSAASCLTKTGTNMHWYIKMEKQHTRFPNVGWVWIFDRQTTLLPIKYRILTAFSVCLRVLVEMLYATCVEGAWTTQNTVYLSEEIDTKRAPHHFFFFFQCMLNFDSGRTCARHM